MNVDDVVGVERGLRYGFWTPSVEEHMVVVGSGFERRGVDSSFGVVDVDDLLERWNDV